MDSKQATTPFLDQHQKYVSWGKLLAGNFLFQLGIQGLGFLTGLLIVRSLAKEDYAYFTIIGTMGPVFNLIADCGITSGMLSLAGKFWQDDERMGRLVRTGLDLRYRFALASSIVIAPILGWMLLRNHASLGTTICLIAITLVGVIPQLSLGVISMVVELRQHLPQIREAALKSTLLRLFIVLAMIGLSCASASWAVFAGACAVILQNFLLTRFVRKQISWNAPKDETYRKEILVVVRKVAPLTIFYSIQGQMGIWLVSILGSAHHVADLGALGRFGVIFSIFMSVASMIAIPRFARIQDHHLLNRRFIQMVMGYLALVLAVVGITAVFPSPFLLLLGSKYAPLTDLVWLVMLSGGLGSLAGLIAGLNNSRGWIPPATITIPLEIITLVILLCILDLSQVRGVLLLSIFAIIPVTLFTVGFSIYNIRKFGRY
jgi:O-antigen/teichoic acid export membrane protein